MSSSTLARVAAFAIGAVVGAGVTAGLTRERSKEHKSPEYVPGKELTTSQPPTGPTDILKYGNPGPISDLLSRKAYFAGYDRRLRHPAWTAEHLTLASLYGDGKSPNGDRSKSQFKEDQSLPPTFRATLQDYFRSGYDRGHMVPAADAKSSQDAMDETFLLSNVAPQVGPGFNRQYWAYVEEWCRQLTKSFADVFVFTVPLYLPKQDTDGKWRITHEVIGSPPNISVPTHFAKVVLTSRPVSPSNPNVMEISTGAFVLPNAQISDDTPFESFSIPVDAVERAAGLTIFSDDIKKQAKQICKSTSCVVTVKRFDDAQKKAKRPLMISSPK